MRFRFVPSNSAAAREKLRLEAHFEQFWATFRDRHAEIPAMLKESDRIVEFMHTHLPMSQGALEWEFGPEPGGGYKLCFSVAGNANLRSVCDRLVELAPSIDGWNFEGYRQPEPDRVVDMLVDGRRGESLGKTWFVARPVGSQLIAIDIYSDRLKGEPTDRQIASACMLVEIIVGEEAFERWIGPISLGPLPMAGMFFKKPSLPEGATPRDQLRPHVETIIKLLRRKLPSVPRNRIVEGDAAHKALITLDESTVLEKETEKQAVAFSFQLDAAKVPERDDYPERTDLLLGTVREMPLLNATLNRFDSARFSQAGETFAYLKIGRGNWTDAIEPRCDIEDSLDAALHESNLGALWGGGTGRRYSYIEMSLIDVSAAINVIREVLNGSSHRPDAAWLLFHDHTLKDEYVDLISDGDLPPPRDVKG